MVKKTPPNISPVMQGLATYISQASKKPLPKNVVIPWKKSVQVNLELLQGGEEQRGP